MSIEFESVLKPALFMQKSEIFSLYQAARDALVQAAEPILGRETPLVIRALRPTDLGEATDVWAEALTGTANTYLDSQIANQDVPDDTVVCIYGLVDTSEPQMVTAVRVKAGQGTRAEWDLFPIITNDLRPEARTAFAMSPVVITKGINVGISYYLRQASPQPVSGVEIVFLGLVAEKSGKNLQP